MNIAQGRYTEGQLLQALRSASRVVWYEYTVTDQHGKTIGTLDITDGRITFDSAYAVMRTLTGTVHKDDLINLYSVDYRVTPWMCLKMGDDTVKWPLGRFLINPSEQNTGNYKTFTILGYDQGKIAEMYYESSRVFARSGSVCTANVSALLSELYDNTVIEDSLDTRNYSNEWGIGENRLTIINQMLEGFGYDPLWFDEYGAAIVKKYILPELRQIDGFYVADELSVMTDGITRTTNAFEIPNMFIRWTEATNANYVMATYTNDDPDNPYSTVSRGRTIVNRESIRDGVATSKMLQELVKKAAVEATMSAEYLTFKTLNMPGHSYRDCLFVDIPQYDIKGKYIETAWEMDLSAGGLMTHRCSKVVTTD